MNRLSPNNAGAVSKRRTSEQANARLIILTLAVFLAGMAVSALWFYRNKLHDGANTRSEAEGQAAAKLADSTEAVLRRLDSPVEIRFYSLLDPANAPDSLKEFANRVNQLLSRYEQDANGKIKVTRYDSQSESNANAAVADGIKEFNRQKGEVSYLGIAVVREGQKECLASLAPEWEQALEFDLTRSIARVAEVPPQPQPVAAPAQPDPITSDAVKRLIPNFDSVSLEDGTRILREASLNELAQALRDSDARVKQAEQAFLQAQTNQSNAGQETARKQLQQLQAEQADKLRDLAAKSQAQIQVLQKLKAAH